MLVPLAPILALLILRQDAVPPAPAPQPPERVRVGLVLIDAAVRDRKDRPIRGLGLGDFELLIDGQPVPTGSIPVFEEICDVGREAPGVTIRARSEGEPPSAAPGGYLDLPAPGHIVVFFDFTALSFSARQLALTAARHFFEFRMAPLDQVKILAHVGGGLYTVQDFTSDISTLKEAIEALARDETNIDLYLVDEDVRLGVAARSLTAGDAACIRTAIPYALAEAERARLSLDRLGKAVSSLRDIKGRKCIVLMSDALRAEPGAQYLQMCRRSPMLQGINLLGEIEALVSDAEAAGVSIHTVHAGGMTDGKEDSVRYSGSLARLMGPGWGGALESAYAMQATLAVQTGGRSLRNTNDLGAILVTAQQDLSCHYELGWAPATEAPDGRRHTISLQLTDAARKNLPRGIQVRHRPFYVDRTR